MLCLGIKGNGVIGWLEIQLIQGASTRNVKNAQNFSYSLEK